MSSYTAFFVRYRVDTDGKKVVTYSQSKRCKNRALAKKWSGGLLKELMTMHNGSFRQSAGGDTEYVELNPRNKHRNEVAASFIRPSRRKPVPSVLDDMTLYDFREKTKWCKRCSSVKTYSDFYKDASRPDGYKYACKACCNRADRLSRGK